MDLMCPPQWGTPRRFDRPTMGEYAAKAAKRLGWDLMPHQRYKLDVALEHDGQGNFYYSKIINVEPRQGGKTTCNLALLVMRVQLWADQNVIYTAQTLNDARKKFRREHVKRIKKVTGWRDGRDFKVRNVNGDESVEFLKTGGWYGISATGEASGHGDTLHLYLCDEAFYHKDERVDQSFLPTMSTVHNPQQWITSAAGDYKSLYLNRKLEVGKAAVEADLSEDICAFIWSAGDSLDDVDVRDPDVWRRTMPALGYTQTVDRIRGLTVDMNDAEVGRAYLCITTEAPDTGSAPISVKLWERQIDLDSVIADKGMIGVAMTPDRVSATLAVAGRRDDGCWHVQHIRTAPGSTWVLEDIREMVRNFPAIAGVALDAGGPAGSLLDEFEAAGLNVAKSGAAGLARSCGSFADGVKEGTVWHRGQPEMLAAVEVARKRPLGDLWAWLRANGDESVAALEAATVALGAAAGLADEAPEGPSAVVERGGLFRWD